MFVKLRLIGVHHGSTYIPITRAKCTHQHDCKVSQQGTRNRLHERGLILGEAFVVQAQASEAAISTPTSLDPDFCATVLNQIYQNDNFCVHHPSNLSLSLCRALSREGRRLKKDAHGPEHAETLSFHRPHLEHHILLRVSNTLHFRPFTPLAAALYGQCLLPYQYQGHMNGQPFNHPFGIATAAQRRGFGMQVMLSQCFST